MDDAGVPRQRVSRETRLLLATVLISLVALSVLARLRFPERPVSVNPVPLLSQLAAPRTLDDLAADVSRIEPFVLPSMLALPAGDAATGRPLPALRFRDDMVLVLVGESPPALQGIEGMMAHDAASGLAVARVEASPVPPLPHWVPQRLQTARYMVAASASAQGIFLRPVFIGSLQPVDSLAWPTAVWRLPPDVELSPGVLVFSTAGTLAGLAARENGAPVLVPAVTVTAAAERLLAFRRRPPGSLGVEVQPLTPEIARATGAAGGVVVTWVNPDGPAANRLFPADVVESIQGGPLLTPERWRVHMTRLSALEQVELSVRRRGAVEPVTLVAAGEAPDVAVGADPPPLGLSLRVRPRMGAEVTAVLPHSVAADAGLRPGDVITRFDDLAAPLPARIASEFADAEPGTAHLVAVTRGRDHLIVALVKP